MEKYDEISISDPDTGDVEVFQTIREAKTEAKKKKYRPVYIHLYDEMGIIDDIEIA